VEPEMVYGYRRIELKLRVAHPPFRKSVQFFPAN
jgi:hypothetical protein